MHVPCVVGSDILGALLCDGDWQRQCNTQRLLLQIKAEAFHFFQCLDNFFSIPFQSLFSFLTFIYLSHITHLLLFFKQFWFPHLSLIFFSLSVHSRSLLSSFFHSGDFHSVQRCSLFPVCGAWGSHPFLTHTCCCSVSVLWQQCLWKG